MSAADREAMVRHDQLATRVYEERRMPAGTRDLVLALGWATLRDPRRHHPEEGVWARTRDILNADDRRMWQLLADDVPCYEHDWHAEPRGCARSYVGNVAGGRWISRTTAVPATVDALSCRCP
ncbi:hypothetical protein ABT007_27850 [Streptomyces griseus]|uniref:hypothetical protein n=1 Tax=Streptomyces griseus TaxID=1911 RepID=UPI0033216FA3